LKSYERLSSENQPIKSDRMIEQFMIISRLIYSLGFEEQFEVGEERKDILRILRLS